MINGQKPFKKTEFFGMRSKSCIPRALRYSITLRRQKKKVNKGAWRMPWVLEAMKDVISCDKLRGLANTN
jgi:hypothetical protein